MVSQEQKHKDIENLDLFVTYYKDKTHEEYSADSITDYLFLQKAKSGQSRTSLGAHDRADSGGRGTEAGQQYCVLARNRWGFKRWPGVA